MFTILVREGTSRVVTALSIEDVGDPEEGNYKVIHDGPGGPTHCGNFHHAYRAPLVLLARKALEVFEANLPDILLAKDPDRKWLENL